MIVMIPLIVNPSTAGGAAHERIKGSYHLSYLVDLVLLNALLLSYLVDLVHLDALLLGCLDVKHLLPDQALTRQDLTV